MACSMQASNSSFQSLASLTYTCTPEGFQAATFMRAAAAFNAGAHGSAVTWAMRPRNCRRTRDSWMRKAQLLAASSGADGTALGSNASSALLSRTCHTMYHMTYHPCARQSNVSMFRWEDAPSLHVDILQQQPACRPGTSLRCSMQSLGLAAPPFEKEVHRAVTPSASGSKPVA